MSLAVLSILIAAAFGAGFELGCALRPLRRSAGRASALPHPAPPTRRPALRVISGGRARRPAPG